MFEYSHVEYKNCTPSLGAQSVAEKVVNRIKHYTDVNAKFKILIEGKDNLYTGYSIIDSRTGVFVAYASEENIPSVLKTIAGNLERQLLEKKRRAA